MIDRLIMCAIAAFLLVGPACDSEGRKDEAEQGKRVRIKAPYADVDVFIPDDKDEEVDVQVDVGEKPRDDRQD